MGACQVSLRRWIDKHAYVDLVYPLAGTQTSAVRIEVDASTIAIGCWKGRASLTVMVTAVECQEMLERLLMRLEGVNGTSQLENKSPDVADGLMVEESNDVEMNEEMEPVETTTAG